MTYPSSRHFLWAFFALSCAVLASTFAFSYWQQPLAGDLTRIGFFSERDYNWRTEQIPQRIVATGAAIKQPDFWVLGDSFSVGNQWQSRIAQTKQWQFQTFHYDKVGCIRDWVEQATQRPSVKTVILEVVEIGLHIRFNDILNCQKAHLAPIETQASASLVSAVQKPFLAKADWRIKHSALTQLNTFQVSRDPAKSHISTDLFGGDTAGGGVVNSPLKPQCALFSNRRNDRLLYQKDSLGHSQKTAADYAQAASNILQLQRRVEAVGKQFLLVVVPDKFSAYKGCIADPAISNGTEATSTCDHFAAKGVACINLMPALIAQRGTVPDLYLPNDTHFSHAGYRLMAEAVMKKLP